MPFKPHIITETEVLADGLWCQMASATTADDTQVKRLEAACGREGWRVSRRYFGDIGNDAWEVIQEGTLVECIHSYNLLS